MASINKCILVGHLGQDPELRYTNGGQPVCNFRMATTEKWGGRDGAPQQEKTEWHAIVVWGRQAEPVAQYLQKGSQAYVEGRIQTREWQDKEGQKRFTTEVVASQVVFLGGKQGGQREPARQEQQHQGDNYGYGDDPLPF